MGIDGFSTNNPGLDLNPFTDAETAILAAIADLADPNVDRILFWDDSAGAYAYLAPGTNLSITGTTLNATGGAAATPYTIVSQSSASYNAVAVADKTIILCDCTANNITINLPTAVSNTATYEIKKTDSTANTVTIDGATTETIDGGLTAVLRAQYASVELICDNANWRIT